MHKGNAQFRIDRSYIKYLGVNPNSDLTEEGDSIIFRPTPFYAPTFEIPKILMGTDAFHYLTELNRN